MLTWLSAGFAPTSGGEIHGKAYEKDKQTAVQGVAVRLLQDNGNGASANERYKLVASTNTGADGRYKVQFASAGDYRIEFKRVPDRCEAPSVSEKGLGADVVKEEDVIVYHQSENLTAEGLLETIKWRVSKTGEPAKAFDDIAALSESGVDPVILFMAGQKLAKENPTFVAPTTGKISSIEHNALYLHGENNNTSIPAKTSIGTVFLDESGKKISYGEAKDSLIGTKATVFFGKEGSDWVAKSVQVQ